MQLAPDLPVSPQLDINALVQTQPDQIEWLLDGAAVHVVHSRRISDRMPALSHHNQQ